LIPKIQTTNKQPLITSNIYYSQLKPLAAMSQLPFFILLALITLTTAASAAYRLWIRPIICDHFGEEFPSRRDRDATERRRSFERNNARVLACVFVASAIGAVAEIIGFISPLVVVGAQIAVLLVGGLFLWAAIAQWQAPTED
jgi:hypothetical protein